MGFDISLIISTLFSILGIICGILGAKNSKKAHYAVYSILTLMILGFIFINCLFYLSNKFIDPNDYQYVTITNDDFKYTIQYPEFLKEDRHNDNMDKRFYNGGVELIISARHFENEIPYDFTKNYLNDTYKGTVLLDIDNLDSKGWYVIEVQNDTRCHYRKCMVNRENSIVRMYTLSVPSQQAERYYKLIDKIEESFRTYG